MKRLYIGNYYPDGSEPLNRIDLDDRIIELVKFAGQQVKENQLKGLQTTTDISVPNSAITTLNEGVITKDLDEPEGESGTQIHVEIDWANPQETEAQAELGYYNEMGFFSLDDTTFLDLLDDTNDVYFGEIFLSASQRQDVGSLILPEDGELFHSEQSNFERMRAEREGRNPRKESL